MILAVYHPDKFIYAGVAVGVPQPVRGSVAVPDQHGDGRRRWLHDGPNVGPADRSRVEAQRPDGHIGQLVANNTRIWVYCGNGTPD